MSALGHKRTFRSAIGVTALPPKADMCGAKGNVDSGPEADMSSHPPEARFPIRAGIRQHQIQVSFSQLSSRRVTKS
jgi:hypothetical protein